MHVQRFCGYKYRAKTGELFSLTYHVNFSEQIAYNLFAKYTFPFQFLGFTCIIEFTKLNTKHLPEALRFSNPTKKGRKLNGTNEGIGYENQPVLYSLWSSTSHNYNIILYVITQLCICQLTVNAYKYSDSLT
jgi:hypothetical protein